MDPTGLRGVGRPPWALCLLRSLCLHRRLTVPGLAGVEQRELGRSIGMGGTASVLIWNMVYDPILYALHLATGRSIPTYVDDTACLLRSPREAFM